MAKSLTERPPTWTALPEVRKLGTAVIVGIHQYGAVNNNG